MYNIEILTITVAVLTILVTALIGWQIFNVIIFEKRMSRMKRKLRKYTEDIAGESSTMSMSANFIQSAFTSSTMGDHNGALKSATNALIYLLSLKLIFKNNTRRKEELANGVVNNIDEIIKRPDATFSKYIIDEVIGSLIVLDSRSAHRAISIIRNAPIKE